MDALGNRVSLAKSLAHRRDAVLVSLATEGRLWSILSSTGGRYPVRIAFREKKLCFAECCCPDFINGIRDLSEGKTTHTLHGLVVCKHTLAAAFYVAEREDYDTYTPEWVLQLEADHV